MGEFGRTPAINPQQGRDHWAVAWSTVLAGGGIKGGQAVGKTSEDGMEVADRPVSVSDFLATVCMAARRRSAQGQSVERRPADPHHGSGREADPGGAGMSRRHAGGGGVAPPLLAAAVGLALLAVVPRPTVADAPAAPQRPADPGEVDDVLDLLYLAPARPYLFRLHVSIDGKPYTARWAERVLKVFQYLDKANDGVLTKEEVALAPSPQQMAQLFHGTPYGSASFNDPSMFQAMDVNEDGKVTPAEFLNYYRRSAGGPANWPATRDSASAPTS